MTDLKKKINDVSKVLLVGTASKVEAKMPAKQRKRKVKGALGDKDVVAEISSIRSKWCAFADASRDALDGDDGFIVLAGTKVPVRRAEAKDQKEREKDFIDSLRLLKGILFKPDHPFRTKLGLFTTLTTSGVGLINLQLNVSSIGSTGEWGSIDALFDEFFIHSVTVIYQPRNVLGDGVGNNNGSVATVPMMNLATANTNNQVSNSGLIAISLFHGASFYGSAAAMLSNPTKSYLRTGRAWSYVWRNNERFDARGPAMSSGTTEAWQGWTLIGNSANYGGSIQMRTFGDVILGSGATALTCGDIAEVYDVSFRARA